ncbi:MAG TPA: glycoside hydrolase family 3 C-terminal domain-containing protein [Acidobacteriaceae bacterium]|jgi:beta-glucosidase|nr:glycoside hydrolase family 3 C-terminal domain-containing protein [Acidobacteriaceae bacterium]
MKRCIARTLLMGSVITMATLFCRFAAAQTRPASVAQDYARARAIVAKMTLDEKITELHGIHTAQYYRYVPGIPRLGIPPFPMTNGPAGAGPGGASPQLRATALPAPIALAASWDPELARRYGVVAAQETRDLASDLLEAPDINIIRVPQNGRTFESYSEDPYLDGRMAVATIEGIQSVGVLANVKHYIANNQEDGRHNIDEIVDERALREIYMPGFKAAVQQGDVASVMCAYPKVNGAFNCENKALLTGVLEDEWKFKGFVMSDWGAVHSTVPSALNGLDLEMPTGMYLADALKTAVQQGQVPISAINEMLVRRFATMMRYGLFDAKPKQLRPIPVLEDGKVSRVIAEQGMVLLKNDNGILPIDTTAVRSVAVIGPDAIQAKTGGGGSSHVIPLYSIAPINGIEARMPLQKHVDLLDGSDVDAAVAAARRDSLVIIMVGDNETEGHDHPIELPAAQNAMIQAVAAANPKTIVVLKSGSALLMPWIDSVAAVLEAWYPGEEDGNAVADVLFGDVNPSGKLPMTFPKTVDQTFARDPSWYPGDGKEVHYGEKLDVGYRWYQSQHLDPLFPFGFGLSYTTFSVSDLKVTPAAGEPHTARVALRVTNTGPRAGAEVAQVYLAFPSIPEGDEPPLQLAGFQKMMLAPGQSKEVTLSLDARSFSYWSLADHAWKVQPGEYTIEAGSSSADLPLKATITMH